MPNLVFSFIKRIVLVPGGEISLKHNFHETAIKYLLMDDIYLTERFLKKSMMKYELFSGLVVRPRLKIRTLQVPSMEI